MTALELVCLAKTVERLTAAVAELTRRVDALEALL